MKTLKLILVGYFIVQWTQQEAVYHPGSSQFVYTTIPQGIDIGTCSIETKTLEERFDDEINARARMTALETDGLKPKLLSVKEVK